MPLRTKTKIVLVGFFGLCVSIPIHRFDERRTRSSFLRYTKWFSVWRVRSRMFSSLSLFFQWGVFCVKFLWHLLAPYYSKKQPCLKILKKVESLYIKKLPRCFFLVLGTKIRIFELARSLIEPNNFWTRLFSRRCWDIFSYSLCEEIKCVAFSRSYFSIRFWTPFFSFDYPFPFSKKTEMK